MTQEKEFSRSIGTPGKPQALPGELNSDFRARLAAMEFEARERRRLDLAEQTSTHNTPAQRIRVWERLHELTLPKKPAHPLIRIIAADTVLTLEQVRDEQRRRSAPASSEPVLAPVMPPLRIA